MNTIKLNINFWNPEREILAQAAKILNRGGLVAFPTETVYGLGADALNAEAVKKIYIAKGRPSDNPLILHVSNFDTAKELVYVDERAEKLMREFWPGPLTLVLKSKNIIPGITRGGLDTAAVRMPDNPVALALIDAAKTPIAAPSANLSGRPSPTDFNAVVQDMDGKIDMILNAIILNADKNLKLSNIGIESTVIDISGEKPLLLRPGGTSREIINNFLLKNFGEELGAPDNTSSKRSPGTRYRHYAPLIPVKICYFKDNNFIDLKDNKDLSNDLNNKNNYYDFKEWGFMGLHYNNYLKIFKKVLIFNSLENYARGLFTGFRAFEAENLNGIMVELPPESGVGLGLRDRILRAAGAV